MTAAQPTSHTLHNFVQSNFESFPLVWSSNQGHLRETDSEGVQLKMTPYSHPPLNFCVALSHLNL